MPALIKFNQFIEDVYHGEHNFYSDPIKYALTAQANPPLATYVSLTNLVQVSLANASTDTFTTISSNQVNGLYSFILDDLNVAAAGGDIGPFRYAVLYNGTNDRLIGYSDYGTEITVVNGSIFKFDFGSSLFTTQ
jgi:hypothetical protein